jgi:hypothetical protein
MLPTRGAGSSDFDEGGHAREGEGGKEQVLIVLERAASDRHTFKGFIGPRVSHVSAAGIHLDII